MPSKKTPSASYTIVIMSAEHNLHKYNTNLCIAVHLLLAAFMPYDWIRPC